LVKTLKQIVTISLRFAENEIPQLADLLHCYGWSAVRCFWRHQTIVLVMAIKDALYHSRALVSCFHRPQAWAS